MNVPVQHTHKALGCWLFTILSCFPCKKRFLSKEYVTRNGHCTVYNAYDNMNVMIWHDLLLVSLSIILFAILWFVHCKCIKWRSYFGGHTSYAKDSIGRFSSPTPKLIIDKIKTSYCFCYLTLDFKLEAYPHPEISDPSTKSLQYYICLKTCFSFNLSVIFDQDNENEDHPHDWQQ